jgi:hypothetical protein
MEAQKGFSPEIFPEMQERSPGHFFLTAFPVMRYFRTDHQHIAGLKTGYMVAYELQTFPFFNMNDLHFRMGVKLRVVVRYYILPDAE